eukprot:1133953-Pelagomonas_calceolata.AAC.1
MSLEDAKLFKQDIYALIVDFTSAFNTTDHDRMLWIMYDLGFPTDAIDTVKNLYEDATTQVRLPSGGNTEKSLLKEAPFKATHYQNVTDSHLANILSSASFADDLLSKTNTIQNLKVQACKVTLYSDWAALIISGSKTKVTGILHSHAPRDKNGVTPSQTLRQQLEEKIDIQGQKAVHYTRHTFSLPRGGTHHGPELETPSTTHDMQPQGKARAP